MRACLAPPLYLTPAFTEIRRIVTSTQGIFSADGDLFGFEGIVWSARR
jgi:hypothetical protein